MYFVECPGFEEQDEERECRNLANFHYLKMNASECIIVMLFGPDELANGGG